MRSYLEKLTDKIVVCIDEANNLFDTMEGNLAVCALDTQLIQECF